MRWVLILALPGGAFVAAAVVLRLLWKRHQAEGEARDAADAARIKPPVQKFTGHDEGLAKLTRQRREAADQIRRRAVHVESGAAVSDVLRLVRR